MKHKARKRFGQNFLNNYVIINQIIDSIGVCKTDKLIEIGPGLGALTKPLLNLTDHLIAIEIDRDLHTYLSSLNQKKVQLELIQMDALEVDYSRWGDVLRIVGNLPYNISTPLLLHLMDYAQSIKDMHFMLQKEVVSRLAVQPGSKAYGRLSVVIQYYCQVEHLFDVPPEAFDPKPKVDSAFVRLIPYTKSPYPEVDIKKLEAVVKQAFSMRRKTIANNLKNLLNQEQLIDLKIDPKLRPEQVTIAEYINLVNFLSK